jgi:hypothetical protein
MVELLDLHLVIFLLMLFLRFDFQATQIVSELATSSVTLIYRCEIDIFLSREISKIIVAFRHFFWFSCRALFVCSHFLSFSGFWLFDLICSLCNLLWFIYLVSLLWKVGDIMDICLVVFHSSFAVTIWAIVKVGYEQYPMAH